MLTDKEIRDKICEINIDEKVIPNYEENNYDAGYLEGFERAAKWARDKCCEWIPVSELPEYIGNYLCLCNDGVQMVCHINAVGQWTLSPPKKAYGDLHGGGEDRTNRKVTHWQPLPQPPKSE